MEVKRRTILIADDSQVFLMYMGIVLKRMGFTVIPVRSGLEVMRNLKTTEPDIVMLDVIMDGVDGRTVLSYIKDNQQISHIPVIMVSQDSSSETIEQCRKLGCAAYLPKPVKIDELNEVLEKHIYSPLGTMRKYIRATWCKKLHVTYYGASYELYSESISEGGMYIRKKEPFPVGSEVIITLPSEVGNQITLRGVVIYTKGLFSDTSKYPPGMAIEFKEANSDETKILHNYVQRVLAQDIFESQEEMVISPPHQNK